jgi:hypothetical protein
MQPSQGVVYSSYSRDLYLNSSYFANTVQIRTSLTPLYSRGKMMWEMGITTHDMAEEIFRVSLHDFHGRYVLFNRWAVMSAETGEKAYQNNFGESMKMNLK